VGAIVFFREPRLDVSNLAMRVAPEHLELDIATALETSAGQAAGAVFLGSLTPAPLATTSAGPKHVRRRRCGRGSRRRSCNTTFSNEPYNGGGGGGGGGGGVGGVVGLGVHRERSRRWDGGCLILLGWNYSKVMRARW